MHLIYALSPLGVVENLHLRSKVEKKDLEFRISALIGRYVHLNKLNNTDDSTLCIR